MTIINLIPPDLLARREARQRLRYWMIRLASTAGGLALLYLALAGVAADRLTEVDRLTGRYDVLSGRLQSAENLIQERNRLAERRAVIELIHDDHAADELLEALGDAFPPETFLTYFSLQRCVPDAPNEERPAPASGDEELGVSQLTLRGLAPSHPEVGEVLHRLAGLPTFLNVMLVSVTDPVDPARPAGVEFEILCQLAEERPHD
jgi:Tfp pilus assembly protein PilN